MERQKHEYNLDVTEASKHDQTISEIKAVRDTLQEQKNAQIKFFITTRIYSIVIQSGRLGFGCDIVNFIIVVDFFEKIFDVVYELDQHKFDIIDDENKKAA